MRCRHLAKDKSRCWILDAGRLIRTRIRNDKSEIQISKSETISKAQNPKVQNNTSRRVGWVGFESFRILVDMTVL